MLAAVATAAPKTAVGTLQVRPAAELTGPRWKLRPGKGWGGSGGVVGELPATARCGAASGGGVCTTEQAGSAGVEMPSSVRCGAAGGGGACTTGQAGSAHGVGHEEDGYDEGGSGDASGEP